jgi:hypothetical protein
MWDESKLAKKRINALIAGQALMTQLAIGALFSTDTGREFNKQIGILINGNK